MAETFDFLLGGGYAWDDGIFDGVQQITVYTDNNVINAFEAIYNKDGSPVPGPKHGGSGGTPNTVSLGYPGEYLKELSGTVGNFENELVIQSLKLVSNKKAYGPFGRNEGLKFSFSVENGKIVGFKGSSGRFLNALGGHAPVEFGF